MLTLRRCILPLLAFIAVSCGKETPPEPASNNPVTPAPQTPSYIHQDPSPDIDISSTDSLIPWSSYYVPNQSGPFYDYVDLEMDGDTDIVFNALNYYVFVSNVTPESNYQRRVGISSPNSSVEFLYGGMGPNTGPWCRSLNAGDTIHSGLATWISNTNLVYMDHSVGLIGGVSDSMFVAFRFVDGNGQYRYGWFHFDDYGIVSGYKLYLTDWAWNNIANMGIPAGEY